MIFIEIEKNVLKYFDISQRFILNENVNIVPKDWKRMLDLVVADETGDSVAKLIKDKDKAVARFVAGLKLSNSPLEYKDSWGEYSGEFSSFGNKALSLGATVEEIKNIYDNTEAPSEYIDRIKQLSGKKLKDRFVSSISKAVLDSGFDINYLRHNGYAITYIGKEAMERNSIVVTNDIMMHLKCAIVGVKCEEFKESNPFKSESQIYTGFIEKYDEEGNLTDLSKYENCFY